MLGTSSWYRKPSAGFATMPLVILCLGAWFAESVQAKTPDFLRDVLPILQRNCDRCHGSVNQEAGLQFTSKRSLLGDADSGEAIVVPNHSSSSLLLQRITDEDLGEIMPPDAAPLQPAEVERIRRWIDAGAPIPDGWNTNQHWAYRPPVDTSPLPMDPTLAAFDIDHFVAATALDAGLTLNEETSPGTLLRRLSLALTGLPAEPAALKAFQQDPSERRYRRWVEHYLASSDFGQHWARHWLDLARYADSNGFQADQLRDSWAYRDWVIDAFNRDMPFDQFVVHQLAGDLLPNATVQSRIATGFHRTPTCNVEAGVHPEANRVAQVFDRVNTTATVFLGTTLECAQCHDHKYDPFSQTDYYRLFAFFNATPLEVEKNSGVQFEFTGPTMDLPLAAVDASKLRTLRQRQKSTQAKLDSRFNDDQFEAWLSSVRKRASTSPVQWSVPELEFDSIQTPPLDTEQVSVLEDGSVLLGGPVPPTATYVFSARLPGKMAHGFRIDLLRDPSIPGGGPGRGDPVRRNVVIQDITASLVIGDSERQLMLRNPRASFSQSGWDVMGAIDEDRKSGWALAPKFDEPHWASFSFDNPVECSDDARIVVKVVQDYGRGRVAGRVRLTLRTGDPELARLDDALIQSISAGQKLTSKQRGQLREAWVNQSPKGRVWTRELAQLDSQLEKIQPQSTLVMVEMEQPRETNVMQRGDYLAPGASVEPGTPDLLHDWDPSWPQNRLGLAKWMVHPDNPLLARVTVNRFWAEIFGRGIVSTLEDFGTQSEPPTHADLLDHLALSFMRQGWSVKAMLREIVLSKTFRRSAHIPADSLDLDPDNRLLARGPRYRMAAETVRDNALAVSGLLSRRFEGAPIMPHQPDGIWRAVGRNQPKWRAAVNEDRYRRGVYVVWKRSAPYPSFVTFDAPDRASCTVKRARTNTPLQSLVLLNDHVYVEAALALADRMLSESPSSGASEIIRYGYELATGKQANEEVVRVLRDLQQREARRVAAEPSLIDQRLSVLPDAASRLRSNQAAIATWMPVASVLLNLDATITLN
ncbi:MAG: PSD1 and planctomycete cytochrome C domain-containing protein [Planctomycetota bacterium]